jgi:uncharacterized membrane protein
MIPHTTAPSALGQPWLLSVLSGIVAVLIYRFTVVNQQHRPQQQQQQVEENAAVRKAKNTKQYTGVFLVVAVLVYGSFMVSFHYNTCKLLNDNVPIQTGGAAPF